MRKAPCFNEQTREDCPMRRVGCRTQCPKWQQYQAEKDREYEENINNSKKTTDLYEYHKAISERIRRAKHAKR